MWACNLQTCGADVVRQVWCHDIRTNENAGEWTSDPLEILFTKYNSSLDIKDLRKLERLQVKVNKSKLDLNFLKNCELFHVYSRFICCVSYRTQATRKSMRYANNCSKGHCQNVKKNTTNYKRRKYARSLEA